MRSVSTQLQRISRMAEPVAARLYSRPALPLSSLPGRSPPGDGQGSETMAGAEALQSGLASMDVSDPQLYRDDNWRPLFARLRREDPVHYCEASPFGPYGSVTRYDDIFAVELDHDNYSASSGRKSCNASCISRSWARRCGSIRISSGAYARCR